MIESDLVRSAVSFLSTLGWIPPCPIELCVSKWGSGSRTISLWIMETFPIPVFQVRGLGTWRTTGLAIKD